MKKLLIAATLATTALGSTALFADPGHRHGQTGAQGASTEHHAEMQKRMQENHARMAANEHGASTERHAEMQKRMQENHARMASHESRGNHGSHGRHSQ
jgi:CCR4-NOT transcriptional regulation complex NOT5 subunit